MWRHLVISYIITALLAILSVFLGVWVAHEQTVKLLLAVSVPVIIFFLADKITSLIETRKAENDFFLRLQQQIPQVNNTLVFNSSSEAFAYLNRRVLEAKTIENTRLSSRGPAEPAVRNSQRAFHRLLQQALRRGTNYSVVVSEEYKNHGIELEQFVSTVKPVGQFRWGSIDLNRTPRINFIVLHYQHDAEVLVGWAISDNYDHTRPVFLLRDERIVAFFAAFHDKLLPKQNP